MTPKKATMAHPPSRRKSHRVAKKDEPIKRPTSPRVGKSQSALESKKILGYGIRGIIDLAGNRDMRGGDGISTRRLLGAEISAIPPRALAKGPRAPTIAVENRIRGL